MRAGAVIRWNTIFSNYNGNNERLVVIGQINIQKDYELIFPYDVQIEYVEAFFQDVLSRVPGADDEPIRVERTKINSRVKMYKSENEKIIKDLG